jgi:hypothetical protein
MYACVCVFVCVCVCVCVCMCVCVVRAEGIGGRDGNARLHYIGYNAAPAAAAAAVVQLLVAVSYTSY